METEWIIIPEIASKGKTLSMIGCEVVTLET